MLGYLIPDFIQRLFVQFVGALPLGLQAFAFAVLCAGLLIAVSWGLRRALLECDVAVAMRARLTGDAPPMQSFAAGWFGVSQWWVIAGLCGAFIVASAFFALGRAGAFGSDTALYDFVRTIQICLGPNSGNGDTMFRCDI